MISLEFRLRAEGISKGAPPKGGTPNEESGMKSLTEVAASLVLALVMLRVSGSLFGIIYEWKLRAGKS